MKKYITVSIGLGFLLSIILIFSISAQTNQVKAKEEKKESSTTAAMSPIANSNEFHVPPPPFSEDIFPCSSCHAGMEVNRQKRVLEDEHTNIIFEHDKEHRWCLDCHNPDDRDKLRLADGSTIDFSVSYLLCGQCHGDKLRDWKIGIHGKRTGYWNGQKEYLLCAHCHNPHSPKFKPMKPLPPPLKPQDIR